MFERVSDFVLGDMKNQFLSSKRKPDTELVVIEKRSKFRHENVEKRPKKRHDNVQRSLKVDKPFVSSSSKASNYEPSVSSTPYKLVTTKRPFLRL